MSYAVSPQYPPMDRKEETKRFDIIDLPVVTRDFSSTFGVPLTGRVELLFNEVHSRFGNSWTVGYEALLRTPENLYLFCNTLDQPQREDVALEHFKRYVEALSSGKGFISLKDDGSRGYYHMPPKGDASHGSIRIIERRNILS